MVAAVAVIFLVDGCLEWLLSQTCGWTTKSESVSFSIALSAQIICCGWTTKSESVSSSFPFLYSIICVAAGLRNLNLYHTLDVSGNLLVLRLDYEIWICIIVALIVVPSPSVAAGLRNLNLYHPGLLRWPWRWVAAGLRNLNLYHRCAPNTLNKSNKTYF